MELMPAKWCEEAYRRSGRVEVCLSNPPFLFSRPRDAVFSHCLGLRSLSAHLRSRGHEVPFVDALFAGFQRVRREDGGFPGARGPPSRRP